jgi:hypothetical protein
MGCLACDVASNKITGGWYPYRWKMATILIVACPDHAREVMIALGDVQNREEQKKGGV